MSGAPFNPMRKTPPPPPHIDTVSVIPTDYITMRSADNYEYLVHRECLRVSPLLRRALAKRLPISLPELTIDFVDGSDDGTEAAESAVDAPDQHSARGSVFDNAVDGLSAFPEGEETEDSGQRQAVVSIDAPFTQDTDPHAADSEEAKPPTPKRPVVLKEKMMNDRTVRISFTSTNAKVLNHIIEFLYFKLRYDGNLIHERTYPQIPLDCTLEVMRIAHVLEC